MAEVVVANGIPGLVMRSIVGRPLRIPVRRREIVESNVWREDATSCVGGQRLGSLDRSRRPNGEIDCEFSLTVIAR